MLQKQSININFAKGLDTKTDPWQVSPTNFLSLQNTVFTTGNRITKRNGFQELQSPPASGGSYITTLNGNLTVVGNSIQAYNDRTNNWVTKGNIQPLELSVLPLIRNNLNQVQVDTALSSSGIVCTVYTENNNGVFSYKYAIADSDTGQNIIAPTLIPVSSGSVSGSPRVFVLGAFFIIVFTNTISGGSYLQYIAISIVNPTIVTTNQTIAATYQANSNPAWDGVVYGNYLYLAYSTASGGQSVQVTSLSEIQAGGGSTPSAAKTFSTYKATLMSLTVDQSNQSSPIIWVNFYRSDTQVGYALAVDQNLNTVLSPIQTITSGVILNLASAAQNALCTLFFEISNSYSYNASIPTNYVDSITITQLGVVSGITVVIRSVGLASKAFIVSGKIYFLSAYQSTYQPTYFLINGSLSTSANPIIAAKLAYENGGGYLTLGLPSISILDSNECSVGYLYKDLISAVNMGTNLPSGTQTAGIYSQTGINLCTFTVGTTNIDTAEIGSDLLITGGFLWMYDGYLPVEQNFFLYPDNVAASGSAASGGMAPQQYYYQSTYEWTDNQGNAYRSTPSIPITVTTIAASGAVQLEIPTLRLTEKIANPAKIVIYRWSVAQQVYYQVTSLTAPILNSTTIDSVSYLDTSSDATILGNNIIYTNGGVLEDTNGPASSIFTLFDTRFWMVDAEDTNLLWYSKQVIENTPVEMSDLLTFYIAPTQAAQGSTGPITALAPMDDKLIIFKANAIYYINGIGPDNTGANNQYSQPIFITSVVGSSNTQSIVFMPQGLMFQSEKGIWLLGRDLSTQYIGAGVEEFNSSIVQSAVNVPETNQVRFTLNTGQTLMYDYYYGQWGTFVGVPAISSCIFQSLHTSLDSYGRVFQENPGSYTDGSNPVLIQLTTAWLNLNGIQGYQIAREFYLLGEYFTPFKLNIGIAYNYNPAPLQGTTIYPTNYSSPYGGATPNPLNGTDPASPYGQNSTYGGPDNNQDADANVLNWRVFLTKKRCTAFQISIQEVYDSTFNVPPGEGLTLTGINLVYMGKSGWRPVPAVHSVGENS